MKFLFPVLLLATTCTASAQTAFDVASIRPSGIPRQEAVHHNPGTLRMENISLRRCISWAWQVQRLQIVGPDWLSDVILDISARSDDEAPLDQLRLKLRSLLTERMGVRVHEELKEQPVYVLTLVGGAPRFHQAGPRDGSRFVESPSDGPLRLGEDNGGLVAEHISMAEFAEQISAKLQRPVIDRTGLRGQYDFRIDVTNYMVPAEGGENGRDRLDPLRVLLVGLQKQLGLKLESGRDTIRTIVVDGANRKPSGN